jgi:glutamine amidotransferase
MNSPEVTIIDYGLGNLLSVQRGFEHCGASVKLTKDPEQVLAADRIVLPGVGAYASAMQELRRLELVEPLRELVHRRTPLLGICLGMQLLLEQSEEFGVTSGLGLIPGRVIPIPNQTISGEVQKIPHIGWNALRPAGDLDAWKASLLADNDSGDAVYFVHSFMAVPTDVAHRLADCAYGGHLIPAVIRRDQVTGCQFHPEKSGEVGLKILRRFLHQ